MLIILLKMILFPTTALRSTWILVKFHVQLSRFIFRKRSNFSRGSATPSSRVQKTIKRKGPLKTKMLKKQTASSR